MTTNKPRIGRCPQCGKSCRCDTENLSRPFCSERCKLIDLGDWFEEKNVISESAEPWSNDPETGSD